MTGAGHRDVHSIASGVVCMAVYRPDLARLERQLQSIRRQSWTGWTCIIGVDGQDPVTVDAISDMVSSDERFSLHAFAENVGFYRNFERLLGLVPSSADWVALSDQDDVWYEDKLEALVPLLATASLVTGSARLVDGDGAEVGHTRRRFDGVSALMFDNQITGSLAVFRSELLSIALPFPAPTDVAYHDHWLGVAAASSGHVTIDSRVVQDYVQHDANVIGEEQGDVSFAARTTTLRRSGGGMRGSLAYLAEHRWGWRVAMARLALERIPAARIDVREALAPFARGTASFSLFRVALVNVVRGSIPLARSAALLVGASFAGLSARR